MDSLTKLYNGATWAAKKVASECGNAARTCPLNPWGEEPKPSSGNNNGAQSLKIRATNSLEKLEKMYYPSNNRPNKQADAGWTEDTVAFSPEALAMMGC